MQERVNLVHGKFSVESAASTGTRIRAVVPLVAANGVSLDTVITTEAAGAAG